MTIKEFLEQFNNQIDEIKQKTGVSEADLDIESYTIEICDTRTPGYPLIHFMKDDQLLLNPRLDPNTNDAKPMFIDKDTYAEYEQEFKDLSHGDVISVDDIINKPNN